MNWDHFKTGLVIPDVELVAQMKHFDHHLSRTTTEWSWRDSKTARSRSLGRMMSQEDPIVKPDYYFETRGMKHYEGGIPEPSWILKAFNNRQHGNFFIDERPIRELSPVKEEQRI